TIMFNNGRDNYGVKVGREVTANLTDVKIMGTGGKGKGVWMKQGTLTMTRGSIEFKGDYGVKIESGVTNARLTDVAIRGEGAGGNGKGVIMESSKTLTMTGVNISGVKMGVEATAGTLTINGNSTIMFNNGRDNYGVRASGGATVELTKVTITGTSGQGKGVEVSIESSRTMTMTNVRISDVGKGVLMNGTGTLRMDNVQISDVAMGVEATAGRLMISGNSMITFKNGSGNYGVKVGSGVT
uniref:hypothetical protein n=1 Tax=Bartonella bovis TaxID=155194 RepID=UPI0013047F78